MSFTFEINKKELPMDDLRYFSEMVYNMYGVIVRRSDKIFLIDSERKMNIDIDYENYKGTIDACESSTITFLIEKHKTNYSANLANLSFDYEKMFKVTESVNESKNDIEIGNSSVFMNATSVSLPAYDFALESLQHFHKLLKENNECLLTNSSLKEEATRSVRYNQYFCEIDKLIRELISFQKKTKQSEIDSNQPTKSEELSTQTHESEVKVDNFIKEQFKQLTKLQNSFSDDLKNPEFNFSLDKDINPLTELYIVLVNLAKNELVEFEFLKKGLDIFFDEIYGFFGVLKGDNQLLDNVVTDVTLGDYQLKLDNVLNFFKNYMKVNNYT